MNRWFLASALALCAFALSPERSVLDDHASTRRSGTNQMIATRA